MGIRRIGVVVALVASTTCAGVGDAIAHPVSTDRMSLEQCRERFVVAPGDDEVVRDSVPAKYELSRDPLGRPLLYVTAITCDRYVVGGSARRTTAAAFAALVKPVDGVGCASAWPVVGDVKGDLLSCNMYVLFAAYDNPSVVAWLRAGTPDLPVFFVNSLSFIEGNHGLGALGQRLEFRAGSGTPSRFRLDAVVRERVVASPFTATFWAETAAGTVRIRFQSAALALGEADGVVTAERDSTMAQMLGRQRAEGARPFTLIAGNRWAQASLTKTVLGP